MLAEQPKKEKTTPTLYQQAQAHFHFTAAMHLNAEKDRQ
jgi:hypothetical protein